MTLLLAYAFLAIGVSFLCSMLEASLLSLPRSYVEALVAQRSRIGTLLYGMQENIDRPLAAILTLNTIAHTVGAAGVGAQAAVVFGNKAVGLASAIMTLLILVLSEIIPKTLGAVHAKSLAIVTGVMTQGMIVLCLPVTFLLDWVTRLMGAQRQKSLISRMELIASIRLGQQSGALKERESRITRNLFALSEIPLAEVVTPRTVVFSLPQETTVQEALAEHEPIRFARIPVYRDAPEDVTGYVTRFDLREASISGEAEKPLRELIKPIQVLPEQASVAEALELMLKEQQLLLLVVDEYGGMEGIITLEDALEALLGEEIVDETDPAADMQELARRKRRKLRQSTRPSGYTEPGDERPESAS